jgi:hypothetical protein
LVSIKPQFFPYFREHEQSIIAATVYMNEKSGWGLAGKVKTTIESSAHPASVTMMRSTAALRSALYRERKKMAALIKSEPEAVTGTILYSLVRIFWFL